MLDSSALWNGIYKNDRLKSSFADDISKGKLSHAYMFEGPDGSGKKLFATTVCAIMAADTDMAKKIFDDVCPDVYTVALKDSKKTIGVDEIRAMRTSAFIKPTDLDFKAYIVDGCENMTVQAQNAMLKLLEEPPESTYFFLLCENVSAMLPTVRSRAPTVRMELFDTPSLSEYLCNSDKKAQIKARNDPDGFEMLLRASGGTIGGAKRLLESVSKKVSSNTDLAVLLYNAIVSKKAGDIYKVCLDLPKKRDELNDLLKTVRTVTRDLTALRTNSDAEVLFVDSEALTKLAGKFSVDVLLKIDSVLDDTVAKVASNINVQNAKTYLAYKLCEIIC